MNRKEPVILALGDLILMAFSLWATLILRYGELPSAELIEAHRVAFLIVFIISLVSFYASGLYGRAIHIARSSVPGTVIRAQIANGLIAIALFYFINALTVTPKVNLLIYIILSSIFVILWRLNTYTLFSLRHKSPAIVIGSGQETEELVHEMSHNPRVGLACIEKVSPEQASPALAKVLGNGHSEFHYIVADMDDPRVEAILPELYQKYFAKARIVDLHDLYEEIFDRIPLSRMNHAWIMSAVSSTSPGMYDFGKRALDIILGMLVGIACLICYPFVALAIKLEDRGPVFIVQERVGQNGEKIRIHKFRTMNRMEDGVWIKEGNSTNKVTRVGKFIRSTRIDELPQALAILKGHMSLIGPRADLVGLAARLEREIPYYNVRTVIPPGLTGWAQVTQETTYLSPQSVEETKTRLSYDLYYITHRSLSLDLRISLRTIRTLLSRIGV